MRKSAVAMSCSDLHWVRPIYIGEADQTWIGRLHDTYERMVGRTRRDLKYALSQVSIEPSRLAKKAIICQVLDEEYGSRDCAVKPKPKEVRKVVFRRAAGLPRTGDGAEFRQKIISEASRELRVNPGTVLKMLFADLADEAIVVSPASPLDMEQVRLRANLRIVQSYLAQSEKVRVQLVGCSRKVIRHVKWRGLICNFRDYDGLQNSLVEISGPLALLQSTRVYGNALSQLASHLGQAEKFVLQAKLSIEGRKSVVTVQSGDPIFPQALGDKFDSKLEEQFAKQFLKATDDWELVREPVPLRSGGEIIFPDFLVRHRTKSDLAWFLEIIGYWTPEYLQQKFAAYRQVQEGNVILCIRDKLNVSGEALPTHHQIVRFKTRIKPADLLAILDGPKSRVNEGR